MTNFDKIKSFDFDAMLDFLCDGANICEYCKYRYQHQCGEDLSHCREATATWLSAEVAENTK